MKHAIPHTSIVRAAALSARSRVAVAESEALIREALVLLRVRSYPDDLKGASLTRPLAPLNGGGVEHARW